MLFTSVSHTTTDEKNGTIDTTVVRYFLGIPVARSVSRAKRHDSTGKLYFLGMPLSGWETSSVVVNPEPTVMELIMEKVERRRASQQS